MDCLVFRKRETYGDPGQRLAQHQAGSSTAQISTGTISIRYHVKEQS